LERYLNVEEIETKEFSLTFVTLLCTQTSISSLFSLQSPMKQSNCLGPSSTSHIMMSNPS